MTKPNKNKKELILKLLADLHTVKKPKITYKNII